MGFNHGQHTIVFHGLHVTSQHSQQSTLAGEAITWHSNRKRHRLRQAHQFSMHRCYFSRVLVLTCFACRHEKFDALVLNCTVQWTLFSFLFFTLLIHSNFDLTGCHVPANRRSAKYGTGAAGSHHLHCLGLNSECFQCFLHSVPVLTEFPPLCRIRCNWEYSFLICIPDFALVPSLFSVSKQSIFHEHFGSWHLLWVPVANLKAGWIGKLVCRLSFPIRLEQQFRQQLLFWSLSFELLVAHLEGFTFRSSKHLTHRWNLPATSSGWRTNAETRHAELKRYG